ncbi:FAD-dependent oxidoreductase [Vagococcus lutrae]|uniref:FAD-dependent oxidoreductase n=1 Tax=Vagococcus lutrae TaxID=81947 RepID=UPI002891C97F|nr:FAD-dependent oxidoreductase [Vagococcus lutrae]MDT2801886.1 FAD-dependent oxidoreductase [Vagococcus lutrae]MDT2826144.1 FAD-dependent oxidoreductase [Vagococcus lutrae]
MKVIIVGGVAGGMSAATRLRRLNEQAEIIVVEKGPHVSFANCGLPYHVSGEIADRESLLLHTPDSLKARFNLDVRVSSEVTEINPDDKKVAIKKGEETYWETYDSLILSPGARPFIPPIEGLAEAKNVFSLRNVPDLDKIMTYVKETQPKKALVIGAGFIGLEMVENLAETGMEVTLVEKAPHVLPPLDEEMAAFVQKELVENDIRVILGQSAVGFENEGKTVRLEDGSLLETDLVIMSVGVLPENGLAESAGIELGMRGGILVDEHYQTNVSDIYAVGDAIIVKQQITGEDAMISLASPANRQGRQVADIISGVKRKNKGSIGTAIVRVFNMSAASTGLSERQAKMAGLNYAVAHTRGADHASYYPGSTPVTLKLVFNPETGQIYGAQGVGIKGVDKRIDVLATAIKGGLTVEDLPELELTYAPPFGVAKDPVNMIGYVALNVIEGLTTLVQWHEVEEKLAQGAKILDVRVPDEFTAGEFKEVVHIPLPQLRERLSELDKDTHYMIACASGQRSYMAERVLVQEGYDVSNMSGSFAIYSVVKPDMIK